MRSPKGFTLIELLVVIAIIGLLASIVMVSLSGAKAKSRDARRQADIKNIQLALAIYYNDNGMYPKNIYAVNGTGAPDTGLAPTYLPAVPRDPNSTTACTSPLAAGCYKYIAYAGSANCNGTTFPPTSYHLGAAVEDTSGSMTANDIDADAGGTYTYSNTACTLGYAGALPFNGNATSCSGTTAANPDRCYDVAP
jgi:type II secretion system protein G